jgi:hypothetical protein
MAFDGRALLDTSADPINSDIFGNTAGLSEGNLSQPDIVSENPQMPLGRRQRQLLRWRVPGLGFVDMYINPQQIVITEKKILTKQRTKGGYVIQYWGEELINVKLSGHTGASGIEGINILRKVYRAEQDSFQQVEQTLINRLNTMSGASTFSGFAQNVAQKGIGSAAGSLISEVVGGNSNPPLLPTLGSLALSVEMYYQGWVFKGFFEDFTVTESVANGVGFFNYDMTFTVVDRRGTRTNFMPFHRSPATFDKASGNPGGFNKADSDTAPMSFNGEK